MSSLACRAPSAKRFWPRTHVGIVSIAEAGRGPLTVPVWYRYEPGGAVRFVTGARSRKARAACARAGRIGFCVQTETPPYQYVSIEGPVTFGEPDPRARRARDGDPLSRASRWARCTWP